MVGGVMRRLPCGRDEEVHQGRRLVVAHIVIGNLLAHRDGEGFRGAAVHLALDDHRVDPGAAIVQRIKAADVGHTGIGVDVHHTDIGPERIGHVRRVIIADRLQPRLQPRDRLMIGGIGAFFHGFEPFGHAFDDKAVHVPFQIVVMHFQKVSRDHLRLGADFPPRQRRGRPGHRGRARAIGAKAVGGSIGVALFDHDQVGGDADLSR